MSVASPLPWEEVRRWRRATRDELIAARIAAPRSHRQHWQDAITARLRAMLPELVRRVVGFYWPFKGEYDPRPLVREIVAAGGRVALPVVVEKAKPLQFREWRPGAAMVPGVWNIPVPADGEPVIPDALLAAVVGFDAARFRLGYGGGYYDRTIAALRLRPLTIGVGFELGRLATIHPQPHDVVMDMIVTEQGIT